MHTNDGSPDGAPGTRARILVGGTATEGRLALIETRERRGGGTLCHRHRREDETIYVLEGDVVFQLDGKRITGSAGTCLFLPAHSEHAYTVTSDEARLLIIVSPAGLEHLYQDLNDPDTSIPRGIEYLASLAARHGIDITGPAPALDT